jgi:hypothetical protein
VKKSKTSHPQSLYLALIAIAKVLGYKYKLIEGSQGKHYGWPNKVKEIHVGRRLSAVDRVVVLAHEIGHILDVRANPYSPEETANILLHWETYTLSQMYYSREKAAWKQAKVLLHQMGGYERVRKRFQEIRGNCLMAYYHRMAEASVVQEAA